MKGNPPLVPVGRRRELLDRYSLVDNLPEEVLDDLTRLAAHICGAPIALISVIDEDRQWFKSRVGLDAEVVDTSLEHAFCVHALQQNGLFVVPDAARDPRFADNPLVCGEPRIRFYAGAPLVGAGGEGLGTLCVIDHQPRNLTADQEEALRVLGRQVMAQLELRRHTMELRASEERFRGTFEQAAVGIAHVTEDGRLLRVNGRLCTISGFEREELLKMRLDDLRLDGAASALEMKAPAAASDAPCCGGDGEQQFRKKDGGVVWVKVVSTLEQPPSGAPRYAISVIEDITVRKMAEFRLHRLNRLHTVLSRICEAIGQTRDLPQLYDIICRVTVEEGRLRMAFIAGADPATRQSRPVAAFGSGLEYLRTLRVSLDGGPLSKGTIGTCHRTGQPDVCHSIMDDPRMEPWREQALLHGFVSTASFPILLGGAAIGALVLFADEKDFFQDDEIRLMVAVAHEISIAIEACQKEHQRQHAEHSLRTSERSLIKAQRIAQLGSWQHHLQSGQLVWSEETFRIFGIPPGQGEVDIGMFRQAVHPEDRERLQSARTQAIEGRKPLDIEHRILRPDGSLRWVQELGELEYDADGHPFRFTGTVLDITARKAAESQLRLLETCVSRLNDIILITEAWPLAEPGPRIVYVNDAFVRLTGYPRGEVLGRSPRFLQGPNTSRSELDRISEALKLSQPVRAELINYTKSGREVWVEIDIVPVAGSSGKTTHLVAVQRDITDRKRAGDALRASEGRFRSFMAHSPAAGWITDASGALRYVSPGYCRMIWGDSAPADSPEPLTLPVPARHFLSGNSFTLIENRVAETIETALRPDGSRGQYLVNLFPVGVEGDEPMTGGMALDITELKRTGQRMRRLVESNVQGVFFWKSGGAISDANDAFLRMTGYSRMELHAGMLNAWEMTPPEFEEVERRARRQLDEARVCDPYEKELLRKDGSRIPVLLGAACFEDDPGEGICFALDLTERKTLEQQFLRAQRVESIGALAGGIAHDLNNALAPIIMSLDLLKQRFKDPDSAELLSLVASSAQRGADMVRQVLSFARGVEGQRLPVSIRGLAGEIEKIVNETFLKHIVVRVQAAEDLWMVMGDATQLHQVLLNLCVNARDAMPEGGTLTLTALNIEIDSHFASLNADARPGPHVLLKVEDTGTGMTPAILQKIFDPFFTTKQSGKGTGLGLSTTITIVRSHGGFVRVTSTPGRGTQFKVYLPAHISAPETAPPPRKMLLLHGKGELILVVDDEFLVRRITRQTLEAFGYNVVLASDGAEAVAIYADRTPEISAVLTDMMMPVMDGPTAIQSLLRMNPRLPIIAASGLSAESHTTQAARLGVQHFLSKPYTAESLLTTLHRMLHPDEASLIS